MKRTRVLGVVLTALVSVAGAVTIPVVAPSTAASAAATSTTSGSGTAFRCVIDAFGQSTGGKIGFRRVVNTRVQVARATRKAVGWRPISWGLVSAYGGNDFETTRQLVASTDGKVRLVETSWDSEDGDLEVRVVKVVGRGYPRRLVTVNDQFIYWVAADRSLRRATWSGRRFVRPVTLPVTISGATAMASYMTDYGTRIYYTDREGALHVVADEGTRSADLVLRPAGYRGVTGLKAGTCMSPDYTTVRPFHGLLFVDRATGVGRFQRALRPVDADGGSVTKSARVRPAGWSWRRLG